MAVKETEFTVSEGGFCGEKIVTALGKLIFHVKNFQPMVMPLKRFHSKFWKKLCQFVENFLN